MAATSLGLVGIVSKGDYNSATTYVRGNFVYHNYCSWLCIVATATGIEPTEQNNTTWQLLAKGINLATFTGATASTAGTGGAVPQPLAGDENKFIRGDGSWASAAADDNFVGTLAQWNALSAADKVKYKTADITDGFNGSPVDSALSDTSTNPVQNRVVKAAIDAAIDVQTGTLIFDTSICTPLSVDPSYIKKVGNIVNVNISIKTLVSIPSASSIGVTIPEGYRTNKVIFPVTFVSNDFTILNCRPTGALLNGTENACPANSYIRANFTYII
jgi:hypothetical protein